MIGKQVLQRYMAALGSIISRHRHSLRTEVGAFQL